MRSRAHRIGWWDESKGIGYKLRALDAGRASGISPDWPCRLRTEAFSQFAGAYKTPLSGLDSLFTGDEMKPQLELIPLGELRIWKSRFHVAVGLVFFLLGEVFYLALR
jgi:hypothetical protein